MSHHYEEVFAECAMELEAVAPSTPEGAASIDFGGIASGWSLVQKLLADLKAKDFIAVAADVRDLLNLFLGSGNGGELVFHDVAAHSPASNQFMKVVGSVLLKLLPLLLGA